MNEAVLILPNQLFYRHPALSKGRRVFLIEERRYFADFRFHKKKLLLHRASMQAYRDRLLKEAYEVQYIAYAKGNELDAFFQILKKERIASLYLAEIDDFELDRRIREHAEKYAIRVLVDQSPNFLTSKTYLSEFFENVSHYSLTHFYIAQRKKLHILVDNHKPVGGKWSYDPENRKRIPRGMKVPDIVGAGMNKYVKEAMTYVTINFPDHPGSVENFTYPVTHSDAEKWLQDFLRIRFQYYGDYQDAIIKDHSFLFHSVISPSLNIGLLDPGWIVQQAIQYSEENRIAMHTVEGFIRQIIGWREFVRALYLLEEKRQRTTNFWNHGRKMPPSFYDGTTGIEPLDNAIERLLEHGYLHHIERLMIVGNFMLLCGIDPGDIYRWFMELFIDAYDWVMVPNVYGLSQYADGGLMTTKPYFSSSHYIRKMSDYPEGRWCEIWDALFWTFINRNREFFSKNPRLSVMVRQLQKMGESALKDHKVRARDFLGRLSANGIQ